MSELLLPTQFNGFLQHLVGRFAIVRAIGKHVLSFAPQHIGLLPEIGDPQVVGHEK